MSGWPLFTHGPRWFRIKGYGVRYVDHRRSPVFFAERNGYRRVLHLGTHCWAWLTPESHPRTDPATRPVDGQEGRLA